MLVNILLFDKISISLAYELSASALNNSHAKMISPECVKFSIFLGRV